MFVLEIKTDNAEFDDTAELSNILRRLADDLENGASMGGIHEYGAPAGIIRDSNGNTVGSWSAVAESDDDD